MVLRILLTLSITITYSLPSFASYQGELLVKNYNPSYYQGGNKIYAITHSPKGEIFIADNQNIIVYNGSTWTKVKVGFPVTSMTYAFGHIYTAGKAGIGTLVHDDNGHYVYESNTQIIRKTAYSHKQVNAKVILFNDEIIYVYQDHIAIISEHSIRIIESKEEFRIAQVINNRLLLYDSNKGLYYYKDGGISLLIDNAHLPQMPIVGFSSCPEGLILWNAQGQNYYYDEAQQSIAPYDLHLPIEEVFIQSVESLSPQEFVVKTYYNGLIILNNVGDVTHKLSKQNRLINNTVLSIHRDKKLNLWVGTANGISVFLDKSPCTEYTQIDGIGTGYGIDKLGKVQYMATSNGLWQCSEQGEYTKLLSSHFVNVQNVSEKLYFTVHSGLWQYENDIPTKIATNPCYKEIKKSPIEANVYFFAVDIGLIKFKDSPEKGLCPIDTIPIKLKRNSNFEIDKGGNIWIERERGVAKVDYYNHRIRYVTRVGSLDNQQIERIINIQDNVYLITRDSIYKTTSEQNKFVASSLLNGIKNELAQAKQCIVDEYNNIWIFADQKVSLFSLDSTINRYSQRKSNSTNQIQTRSFPQGYASVKAINDSVFIIGEEEGFAQFCIKKEEKTAQSPLWFEEIYCLNRENEKHYLKLNQVTVDSCLISEVISFDRNNITFRSTLGASYFGAICYQHKLIGYDTEWSEWQDESHTTYTNLPAGKYHYSVRTKGNSETIFTTNSCLFEIAPLWYLTLFWKIFYVIVLIFVTRQTSNYFKRKRLRAMAHLIEVEEVENQKDRIKRQKIDLQVEYDNLKSENKGLKQEILDKSKELANANVNLVKKNQLIVKAKNEIMTTFEKSHDGLERNQLKQLIRTLEKDLIDENNWDVFEKYFDTIHEKFFLKLNKKYPTLTSKDLRLCAYLRMNSSTKEIASLLNLTVRGVEIGRYRLRKKLNLDRDVKLNEFLNKF